MSSIQKKWYKTGVRDNPLLSLHICTRCIVLPVVCLLITGCGGKHYLSLRQIPVGADSLASSHVATPDPRQATPPRGQKIVIQWAVAREVLRQNPQILFQIVYKNHTTKSYTYPVTRRLGYEVYSLLNQEFDETGGVLTYSAELMTKDGHICATWHHQLWVNLITVEDDGTPTPLILGKDLL